jgi:alcohol-forming fatty acyl-CoA reductase
LEFYKNLIGSHLLFRYEEPQIYNFVTSEKNSITWEQYTEYGRIYGETMPPMKSLWYPSFQTTSSKVVVEVLKVLYHLLPALLIDTALLITGKNPKLEPLMQ